MEGIPLCIGGHPFCLSTKEHSHHCYNTWGVKYNNYHFVTFTVLVSTRGFNTSTEPIDIHNGKHMSLCPVNFFVPSLESLEWERCQGHQPFKVMNYSGAITIDWNPDHGQF